jgi:hypothetical protein
MADPTSGNSDFLLAVEIGELSKLEALAAHLKTIRDAAATPVNFTVNVKAPGLGKITSALGGSGGSLSAGFEGSGRVGDAIDKMTSAVNKLHAYVSGDMRTKLHELTVALSKGVTTQDSASAASVVSAIGGLSDKLEGLLLNGVSRRPRVPGRVPLAEARAARSGAANPDLHELVRLLRDPTVGGAQRRELEQAFIELMRTAGRTQEDARQRAATAATRRQAVHAQFPELVRTFTEREGALRQNPRQTLLRSGVVTFSRADKVLQQAGFSAEAVSGITKARIEQLEREASELRRAGGKETKEFSERADRLTERVVSLRAESEKQLKRAERTARGPKEVRGPRGVVTSREELAQFYRKLSIERTQEANDVERELKNLGVTLRYEGKQVTRVTEPRDPTSNEKVQRARRLQEEANLLRRSLEAPALSSLGLQAVLPVKDVKRAPKAFQALAKGLEEQAVALEVAEAALAKSKTPIPKALRPKALQATLQPFLSNPLVAARFVAPEQGRRLQELDFAIQTARAQATAAREREKELVQSPREKDLERRRALFGAAVQNPNVAREDLERYRTRIAALDEQLKAARARRPRREIPKATREEQQLEASILRERRFLNPELVRQRLGVLRRAGRETESERYAQQLRFLDALSKKDLAKNLSAGLERLQPQEERLAELRRSRDPVVGAREVTRKAERETKELQLEREQLLQASLDLTSAKSLRGIAGAARDAAKALSPFVQVVRSLVGETSRVNRKFADVNPSRVFVPSYVGVGDERILKVNVDEEGLKQIFAQLRQGNSFQAFGSDQLSVLQDALAYKTQALAEAPTAAARRQIRNEIDNINRAVALGGEWYDSRGGVEPFKEFRVLQQLGQYPRRDKLSPDQRKEFDEQFNRIGVGPGAVGVRYQGDAAGAIAALAQTAASSGGVVPGALATTVGLPPDFEQLASSADKVSASLERLRRNVYEDVPKRVLGSAIRGAELEARAKLTTAQADEAIRKAAGIQEQILNRKTGEEIERRQTLQFREDLLRSRPKTLRERLSGAVSSLGDRFGLIGSPQAGLPTTGADLVRRIQQLLTEMGGLQNRLQTGQFAIDRAGTPALREQVLGRQVRTAQELDARRALFSELSNRVLQNPQLQKNLSRFEAVRQAGQLPPALQELTQGSFDNLRTLQEADLQTYTAQQKLIDDYQAAKARLAAQTVRTPTGVRRAQTVNPTTFQESLSAVRAAQGALAAQGFDPKRAGFQADLSAAQGKLRGNLDQSTTALINQTQAWLQWNRAAKATPTFLDGVIHKARTLTQYLTGGFFIYGAVQGVSNLTREVTNLESELAKIRGIFPNRGLNDILQVEAGAVKASQDYGTSLRETVALTKTFAQLGLTPEASVKETRAALLGARGAGLEPAQAVETIIAVRNLSDERTGSVDILDRISRIEARNAVTAQDLSIALQRVGSLAVQLQPQREGFADAFDTVIAATTQIVEETRVTGNQAATSLRFIFARLTAPEIAGKLQNRFGIRLATEEGGTELRPLIDILGDIAKQYELLSTSGRTIEAAQLLQTVAGARQINAAAALFKDFNKVLATATASSLAFGDTEARLALQQDTLRFKLDQLSAASVAAWSALLRSSGALDAFKAVVGGATKALNFLGSDRSAEGNTRKLVTSALAASVIGTGLGALGKKGVEFFGARAAGASVAGASGVASVGASAVAGAGAQALSGNLAAASRAIAALHPVLRVIAGVLTVLSAGNIIKRLFGGGKEAPDFGITREQLLASAPGQRFEQSAAELGVTPDRLSKAIFAAAEAGRRAVRDAFGKDVFGVGVPLPDDDSVRGSRELYQKTVVKTLSESISALNEIADPAQRAATALDLLRNAAQYAGGPGTIAAARLETDLSEELQRLKERFAAEPGAIAKTLPTTAQAVLTGRLGKRFVDEFEQLKFPFLETLDREMGRQYGKFSDALTKVTRQFLAMTPEQEKLVAKLREQVRTEFPKAGQDFVDKQVVERLAATPELQATERNRQDLAEAIYRSMRAEFQVDRRIQQAGAAGQDIFGTGGPQEGESILIRGVQAAFARLVDEVRRSGQSPEAQALLEDLTKAQNSVTALRGLGKIDQRLRVRPARDYTLEVLSGFLRRGDEIEFGRRELRPLGVGYDITQARADASREALQGLAGVRSRIEGDLLQALNRLSELPEPTKAQLLSGVFSNDENARRVAGKTFDAISGLVETEAGVGAAGGEDARLRIEAQVADIGKALQEVEKNRPLLEGLGTEFLQEQEYLSRRIREALDNEEVSVAVLTFAKLMEDIRRIAKTTQEELERRSISKLTNQYIRDRASVQFGARQELRELTETSSLRRQGVSLGQSSDLPVQLASIRLAALGRVEVAQQQEANARKLALDQFGPLGEGSAAKLNEAFLQAQNDRQLEELRASLDESAAVNRLLEERTTDLIQQRAEEAKSLSRSGLGGLRDVLAGGYESLRGPTRENRAGVSGKELLGRIVEPLGSTITSRLADNFIESLIGPSGVLGLQQLFSQDLLQQQSLLEQHRQLERVQIREGAKEGIIAGAAALEQLKLSGEKAVQQLREPPPLPPVPGAPTTPGGSSSSRGAGVLPTVRVLAASGAAAGAVGITIPDLIQASGQPQRAKRNNNPGNLKFANQRGASLAEDGFAKFETPEDGWRALINQIRLEQERGLTLKETIEKYAPRAENDTTAYISAAEKALGTGGSTKLSALSTAEIAKFIAKYESQTSVAGFASSGAGATKLEELIGAFSNLPESPSVPGLSILGALRPAGPAANLDVPNLAKQANPFLIRKQDTVRYQARQAQLQLLKQQAAAQIGILGGGFLGNKLGVNNGNNYASSGAAVGTAVGSLFTPVGGIVGGLVGGLLGGRFGRPKQERPIEFSQAERIAANTRETVSAIENQTRTLLNLEDRLLNVPASFVVPQYRPFGAAAGAAVQNFSIQIDARGVQNPGDLANMVARKIVAESARQAAFLTIR